MAKPYSIVPVNTKTGKEIKRPKKGQEVRFALKSPRGTLKKIPHEYSQKFLKTDLEGLNRILKKAGHENLVFFEQRTNEILPGKYRTKKDINNRKIPLRKTKITFQQSDKQQRTIVITKGKTLQALVTDGAMKKQTRREKVDAMLARVLTVQTKRNKSFSKEIHLTGETIFATLKNIRHNVTDKILKKYGANTLYVEGTVRIYYPQSVGLMRADNFSYAIKDLRNFSNEIAKQVRYKLMDVGYRFTSLAKLRDFQEDLEERGADIDLFERKYNRKPVDQLLPLIPENDAGARAARPTSSAAHRVSISLRLTAVKDPTRKPRKPKKEKTGKVKKSIKKTAKKKIAKKAKRKK